MNVLDTYIQPSIEILNIRVDEPITTLTDLAFAAICFFAFYRIHNLVSLARGKRWFKYYFLVLGLGALSGGLLGHAFLYRIAHWWKFLSWILLLGSVVLIVQALLEIAKPYVEKAIFMTFSMCNPLILLLALFLTLKNGTFAPVTYFMVFSMVMVVGSLCYFIYGKTRSRGALLIIGAVGVGIFSALIFSFGWGLSPWFNHNDISHVILSGVSFSIYKGAAILLEASDAGP